MASMNFFRKILMSRGIEAAAAYATAAQFGPGLATVRRLREEVVGRPLRPGKTAREGGRAAAIARKAAKRAADAERRAKMRGAGNGGGGKKH